MLYKHSISEILYSDSLILHKLYMRQLKSLGLNCDGLRTFYITNIRSVMMYCAPAWFTLLSATNKSKLEKVKQSATSIMLTGIESEARLAVLN